MTGGPLRLVPETLARAAARHPQAEAVVAGGRRLSYLELWTAACAMASALRAAGVGRGDRVAICLENDWRAPAAIYGAALADAVIVVVDPGIRSEKLAFILQDSGAAAALADAKTAPALAEALALTAGPAALFVSGASGPLADDPRLRDLDAALDGAGAQPPRTQAISVDLAAIIYTSGSTGEPKGVMQSHQSMIFVLQSVIEYLGIGPEDRILCAMPLAFGYGLYQLFMAVEQGATLVLEASFTYLAQTLALLERERITVLPGVPTIFATLAAAHARRPMRFPGVRAVTSAGASLPPSLHAPLAEMFPEAALYRMYGQTECKRISYLPPSELAARPTSVGIAIPGTEVMILDEAGAPVGPGEPGVLHVRGAHVMLGYWNQPEKTAAALRPGAHPADRVLCTNDVFTRDEGFLYFVARGDDIIKSRGEKVSPLEVETAIHHLEGVREAAVVGAPDPILGEAIVAFVAPQEGCALTEAQVRKHCEAHLQHVMTPKRVVLLDALPKTPNGKIDKSALKRMTAP